jgi:hypothetical protein
VKRAFQLLVFVLCVGFSVAAVYNVLSDNTEVERKAKAAACQGKGDACAPFLSRLSRTPLGEALVYDLGKTQVEVRCTRAYVLAGEYACAIAAP